MSTGGRVFPSITGGGLTRAGQAIFEAVLARRDLEQRERLQGRQLDIADRANRLNQFVTLAKFLPPGAMLGDLGIAGRNLFESAFDMDAEGLEALELNPETIDTIMQSQGAKFLRENPDLFLPSLRAQLGLEPDEDVATARNLQAQLEADALTEILNNPDMRSEFVSRRLGRDPVTVTIPGFGGRPDRSVTFDSTTAANIYAQFLLARERFGFELDLQNEEAANAIIEEIQGAVERAGFSVSSVALKGRVLPAYNQAVQSGDIGSVLSFIESASEGEGLAMQFLLGSIKAGEETFLDTLRESAPALSNFLELGAAIREVMGPEAATEVLPSITRALGGTVATLRDPLFRGLRLEFEGAIGAQPARGVAGFDNVPRDVLIEAAKNLFNEGTQTRAELEASLGADVVRAALGEAPARERTEPVTPAPEPAEEVPQGGFDPAQVPASVQSKARQLNTLLRRRERAAETGTTIRGVENAIGRLQDEIRSAIRLPSAQQRLEEAVVPEGRGAIPPGGLNPNELPQIVQKDVLRLNTLLAKPADRRNARDNAQISMLRNRIEKRLAR